MFGGKKNKNKGNEKDSGAPAVGASYKTDDGGWAKTPEASWATMGSNDGGAMDWGATPTTSWNNEGVGGAVGGWSIDGDGGGPPGLKGAAGASDIEVTELEAANKHLAKENERLRQEMLKKAAEQATAEADTTQSPAEQMQAAQAAQLKQLAQLQAAQVQAYAAGGGTAPPMMMQPQMQQQMMMQQMMMMQMQQPGAMPGAMLGQPGQMPMMPMMMPGMMMPGMMMPGMGMPGQLPGAAAASGHKDHKPRKERSEGKASMDDPPPVPGGGPATTLMLRNLPNDYTRDMMLVLLDGNGFTGAYDFFYLPIDFKSSAGLGYAFVNLVDGARVRSFWQTFEGFSNWSLPSQKVCSVSWSNPHQGLDSHIERFRNSFLMHDDVPDEHKPVLFKDGARTPFPPPTRKLQAPRPRQGGR